MVVSRKLVAMPMAAKTHIQKIAPAPPEMMAVTGPAMLPTPMREPMLMQKTWKEEIFPGWGVLLRSNVVRTISPSPRNWTPLRRTVARTPMAAMTAKATYQM